MSNQAVAEKRLEPHQSPEGQEQPAAQQERKTPPTLFVLDSTAIPGKGTREHVMIVDGLEKPFRFEPGIPLQLPVAVAIKFLKHDEFKLCNPKGDLIPYQRRPKQPNELEAGETFKIADDETIAKYGELTNRALFQRALELPGGEAIRDIEDRQGMIDFITRIEKDRREANKAKQPDIGKDDFVPIAEVED
jgi:hypothetical protein